MTAYIYLVVFLAHFRLALSRESEVYIYLSIYCSISSTIATLRPIYISPTTVRDQSISLQLHNRTCSVSLCPCQTFGTARTATSVPKVWNTTSTAATALANDAELAMRGPKQRHHVVLQHLGLKQIIKYQPSPHISKFPRRTALLQNGIAVSVRTGQRQPR